MPWIKIQNADLSKFMDDMKPGEIVNKLEDKNKIQKYLKRLEIRAEFTKLTLKRGKQKAMPSDAETFVK